MPGYEFFGDDERKELLDVIDTGILMRYGFDAQRKSHWKAKELEKAISTKLEVGYTQLVSSGTAALTTALAALGVGVGDEVIMPAFTFVASFESVLSVGATPILVDVDDTLTLSPEAISKAITPKTKVVMPVHMCGAMADMEALQAICEQHQLILLEDACQAFGASYKGKYLGTIGDAGAFSFDFVKTITCGEGGAIITNNKDIYDKCDAYSDHGHDHLGVDRGADLHPYMGYNYRISELHAAVGLGQLKKLDKFLTIQRNNKKILKDAIATLPEVTFRRIPDEEGDNASFLSFFLPDEDTARKAASALKASGIASLYWYDNNWHYIRNWTHFKNASSLSPLSVSMNNALTSYENKNFIESDRWISCCISTPINIGWSEEELQQRKEMLLKAIKSVL